MLIKVPRRNVPCIGTGTVIVEPLIFFCMIA